MTARRGIRIVVLVGLLAFVSLSVTESIAASPSQQSVQARIAEVVRAIAEANRGGDGGEIPAMADELSRLTDGDRDSLLLELVRYLAGHPGNEPAMGAALLIDYYAFTDDEKIGALAPHVGTDDARLRDAIWEVLGTVDRPQGAGESVRRVQHLDQLLQRVEQNSAPESESARREIDELSRDELWWIRLYTAHLVRSHPDLGPDIAERLRTDTDPRVRRAAGG
jgi:hypothetical protein